MAQVEHNLNPEQVEVIVDGLKGLNAEQVEAIVKAGIEYGAYSDEMPDTKKEKQAAAEEILLFSIDSYINDDVRPDDDDPGVAESGEQIEEIFELAGVEIGDDSEISFEGSENGTGDSSDDDGEEPFDPDSYIEGYSELSALSKLKKVKALDAENEDDAAVLEALADWENEQDKPSSRVLSYIEETLGEPEGESDDSNGDEPEAEGDDEGEANDEPWEGYDKATAKQIKDVLADALEADEDPLTVDQVEYVLDYEQNRKAPRKRVIDYCNALLEEMKSEEDGDGDDEPEAEAEPEKPARGRGRGRGKKAEPSVSNGVITLTREQILTALTEGEVEIEV